MASFARRIACYEDADDYGPRAVRVADYVEAAVPVSRKRSEMATALTASQRIRRRHRAWMVIIDKGLQTYAEIAVDLGCHVSTVYRGVERARLRERKIKERLERHGL